MGQVYHVCATTTHVIRAAIQRSQGTTAALSRELSILTKMENRNHVNRTFQRMFNCVLDTHGFKLDLDGQPRTTYSLFHYELQTRLNKSSGKVNIYDLARDKLDDRTPLHAAIFADDAEEKVKILLDAGADIRAKDKNGKTAWDYARESDVKLKFEGTKAYRSLKPKWYN